MAQASGNGVPPVGAPRNNGKHPGGRPTKYRPEYPMQLVKYFASRKPYTTVRMVDGESGQIKVLRHANDPPLLVDFARKIKVTHRTLEEWAHVHPEFFRALEEAKRLQEKFFLTCGFLGLSNPTITALVLKSNHGYRDKQPDEAPNVNVQVAVTMVEGLKAILARKSEVSRV